MRHFEENIVSRDIARDSFIASYINISQPPRELEGVPSKSLIDVVLKLHLARAIEMFEIICKRETINYLYS